MVNGISFLENALYKKTFFLAVYSLIPCYFLLVEYKSKLQAPSTSEAGER